MADSETPLPAAPAPLPRVDAPRGNINRTAIGFNVAAQLAMWVIIIFFVNAYSFRQFKRWDLSHNQNYELSSKTKNILANLEQPVRAIVFFPQAQMLTKDVGGLLREYEFASNKKFTVEFVDPYKNLTRARELAEKYKFGSSDNIVILDYKGKSKFVNAQEMAEFDTSNSQQGQPPVMRAFKGEETITSAIQGLTGEKEIKLYVIAGHGEASLENDPIVSFKEYVKRENIKAVALNLSNIDSVPADATGLMIFGPKSDFTERELLLLSEYWNQHKGRFFVALNPAGKTPQLDNWLALVGVKPQNDRVLRTGSKFVMENGQPVLKNGLIFTSPTAVYAPDGKPITRELAGENTQLLGATESLDIDSVKVQGEKVKMTIILHSGEGFWGETEYVQGENRNVFFDPKKDHMGPLTLGVAIEKGGIEDPRVKVDTSRMILLGNSNFMTDEGLQQANNGIDFALSCLNWIFNRELVSGIPPKPKVALSLDLDERMIGNIFSVTVILIPLTAGIFGLYVSWFRRNKSVLTLSVWLLGIGMFVWGSGWALNLFLEARESGVNKVAANAYLIPALLIAAPLLSFALQLGKLKPADAPARPV